jgi:IS30 family transposase
MARVPLQKACRRSKFNFGSEQVWLAQYTVRMKKHNKITAPERDQIAWWLACGITIREMARRLGRSPSSISAELKRNKADGVYGSIKAHRAAVVRKLNPHQKNLLCHRQS